MTAQTLIIRDQNGDPDIGAIADVLFQQAPADFDECATVLAELKSSERTRPR
jgi:hypothetical protein